MQVFSKAVKGFTETYVVKFWYTCSEGYLKQSSKEFWCNSKSAHRVIEVEAIKFLLKEGFSGIKIISVIYQ